MLAPDLSLESKPSVKPFFCVAALALFLAFVSGVLRLGGLLPHGVPLQPGAPRWYRIFGYIEELSIGAAICLWASTLYNAILVSTPNDPEGDPVHIRSPILWSNIFSTSLGMGLIVAAYILVLR